MNNKLDEIFNNSKKIIIDDDSKHITSLTMECYVDKDNPRTEMEVIITDV